MKNNLAPYLSWLLKERPFAAPKRGDDPTDIANLPPIKYTSSAATPAFAGIPSTKTSTNSSQSTFTAPTPQQSSQVPYNLPRHPASSRAESIPRASTTQFSQEAEDMARLRIEPTPKRPKLTSAVQTPRAINSSSTTEVSVTTPAVKPSAKNNSYNPYGIVLFFCFIFGMVIV